MTILPEGFYTALGTPLDEEGRVLPESLAEQTRMQIRAGAAGFLVLGSMGIQAYVRQDQGPRAVAAVAGAIAASGLAEGDRPALLAGAMDNSIRRVLQRIEAMAELPLAGIVLTTPYYGLCSEQDLFSFFTAIADRSPLPIYLYDLPGVTKIKITFSLVRHVADHPNIRGIKSGDPVLARSICRDKTIRERFCPVFSGLDIFDMAVAYGITRFLDGMFACAPETARKTFEYLRAGKIAEGGDCLDRILRLRDVMFTFGIFPAFTVAMNLLGLPGRYGPDYENDAPAEATDVLRGIMNEMGEPVR